MNSNFVKDFKYSAANGFYRLQYIYMLHCKILEQKRKKLLMFLKNFAFFNALSLYESMLFHIDIYVSLKIKCEILKKKSNSCNI